MRLRTWTSSSIVIALGVSALACVGADASEQEIARWDVRGNYALEAEDTITVTLTIGGVERRAVANGYDELVDLGTHMGEPLVLDLSEHCGKPEVTCPNELLWESVAIDVRDVNKRFDSHILNVVNNTVTELPAGQSAQVLSGLVDHKNKDRFVLGLGSDSASQGDCGALAISLASGRFEREGETLEEIIDHVDDAGAPCTPSEDLETTCMERRREQLVSPDGAPVVGIAEGKIGVGWLGACAFGPVLVGATLTIEATYSGRRTGDFDPPTFTPVETHTVPEMSEEMTSMDEAAPAMEE